MNPRRSPLLVALAIIAGVLIVGMLLNPKKSDVHEPTIEAQPQAEIRLPPGAPQNAGDEAETLESGSPKHYEPREFDVFLQKFQSEAPHLVEMRALPKHAQHPRMLEAYVRSGRIARAAIRQPELREAAFTALEQCANLRDNEMSLRSMCLRQHRKIRAATRDTSFDERNRFPDIKALDALLKRSLGE